MDYIAKPFVPAIMLQRVRRTLELENYRKNLERMVERQLRRITQLQQDIVITMANLIESRDGITGEHVKRTSAYVNLLVRKVKEKGLYEDVLSPTYIDYMQKASPLHDIGKLTVPDRILQKPGALTKEEYGLIQLHAEEGGRLIQENMKRIAEKEFVDVVRDMAAGHHEKWAGGYPHNLKGEEIPLAARILAIADVFDALVSERQYKKGMYFLTLYYGGIFSLSLGVARKGDKTIELMVDCDPNIPEKLYGDEIRIRQVIINLLTNAIKFTQKGGVIHVESQYGNGTEFTVVIPQKTESETPIVQVENRENLRLLCYVRFPKFAHPFVTESYYELMANIGENLGIPYQICQFLEEVKQELSSGRRLRRQPAAVCQSIPPPGSETEERNCSGCGVSDYCRLFL